MIPYDYVSEPAPVEGHCTTCGAFDELDERGECTGCHRGECEECGDLTKVDREGYCDRCRPQECPYCGRTMTASEHARGQCAECWRVDTAEQRLRARFPLIGGAR